MFELIEFNTVALVVALLVGFVIGWWLFKGRREVPKVEEQTRPTIRPAPAAEPEPEPIASPPPAPVLPATDGPPDPLETMKGVGPKFANMLRERGIMRFDQLAALSEDQAAALDSEMGAFRGRIARDRVVEQARFLAAGDHAGFEERFGKLGG